MYFLYFSSPSPAPSVGTLFFQFIYLFITEMFIFIYMFFFSVEMFVRVIRALCGEVSLENFCWARSWGKKCISHTDVGDSSVAILNFFFFKLQQRLKYNTITQLCGLPRFRAVIPTSHKQPVGGRFNIMKSIYFYYSAGRARTRIVGDRCEMRTSLNGHRRVRRRVIFLRKRKNSSILIII